MTNSQLKRSESNNSNTVTVTETILVIKNIFKLCNVIYFKEHISPNINESFRESTICSARTLS